MESLAINGVQVKTECPMYHAIRQIVDIQDRADFGRMVLVFQGGKLVEMEWARKTRFEKPA